MFKPVWSAELLHLISKLRKTVAAQSDEGRFGPRCGYSIAHGKLESIVEVLEMRTIESNKDKITRK